MSSGGKGGETSTEIDPDVKRVMMDMAARGKQISQLPKLNYQGLTMAAPSAAPVKVYPIRLDPVPPPDSAAGLKLSIWPLLPPASLVSISSKVPRNIA